MFTEKLLYLRKYNSSKSTITGFIDCSLKVSSSLNVGQQIKQCSIVFIVVLDNIHVPGVYTSTVVVLRPL